MPENKNKEARPNLRQVSHELRNTLGAIYNYAQLLELSLTKKDMSKEADIAREIVHSVEKMNATLAEKLDPPNS